MNYSSCLVIGLFSFLSASCAAPGRDLFNSHDFSDWEFVAAPATQIDSVLKYLPDGAIAATGQPVGYIASVPSYENYRLHFEWRWPGQAGNGGVLLHISSGPKDRAWPVSIQVQTKSKAVGDLLPMAGATFAEPLTSAPGASTAVLAHHAADSEKPVGGWNSCDVTCQHGTIEVSINGIPQNKITSAIPHSGRIGFQFEGTPYELRRVSLVSLE